MIELELIRKDYARQIQRARDLRTAIYVSVAILWTVAIFQSFQWWYLGAILVSMSVIEIWHFNLVKQLAKSWRKEINAVREGE